MRQAAAVAKSGKLTALALASLEIVKEPRREQPASFVQPAAAVGPHGHRSPSPHLACYAVHEAFQSPVAPLFLGACHLPSPDAAVAASVFTVGHGATLPLHDHPGMWVVTKILYGSMQAVTMDPATATVTGNAVLAAGATHITTPTDTNVHAFRAASPGGCAFLDVFMPPYDYTGDPPRRPCNYYEALLPPARSGASRSDCSALTPQAQAGRWDDESLWRAAVGDVLPLRRLEWDPPWLSFVDLAVPEALA